MRLFFAFWLTVGVLAAPPARRLPVPEPPAVPREFRGMWVASVGNIDWPTRPGAPAAQQQTELRGLLDLAVKINLNAVILQVRPSSDALYESRLEPWSEYLTGRMGQAPNPLWDPLKFACDEAHARGLELHAWINPFRARYFKTVGQISPDHMARRHPEWTLVFGGYMWLDPGVPEIREHVESVALDIVSRYDVDGLHLDDYFYPYPMQGGNGNWLVFPDAASFSRYRSGGGRLDRDDWRRDNVNHFVEELYTGVHRLKPWVKVGISPFGIWRPDNPPGIKGLDQFAVLYSDSRQWLSSGWCDYLAPQLYWPLSRREQSFPVLLRWWEQQNSRGRLLIPGLNSSKIGDDRQVGDTLSQIRLAREGGASGVIFYNASSLRRDFGGLASALPRELFAQPALVPATPWLTGITPEAPEVTGQYSVNNAVLSLTWTLATNAPTKNLVMQQRLGVQWRSEILLPTVTGRTFDRRRGQVIPEEVRVRPISRAGVEGEAGVWKQP